MLEVMEPTESAAVPVLETVIVCVPDAPTVTLSKASEVEDREIAGAGGATPVPDRETVDGLPAALWERVNVPDCDPVAVGVKETVTVPTAPAARLRLAGETVN